MHMSNAKVEGSMEMMNLMRRYRPFDIESPAITTFLSCTNNGS